MESAVIDTPVCDDPILKRSSKQRVKPKRIPPYAVIIENDDEHTYPYVIELIQKVFGYDKQKAQMLTERVDNDGEAHVWTGSKEVAELKVDQVRGGGTDFYASKPVTFPIGCRMEPLPS